MYQVKMVERPFDWADIPKIELKEYSWGGTYRPYVSAQMVLIKGEEFRIRMECDEKDPLARYTENNTLVCTDSCMECFVIYKPELNNGYINFESNANGALWNAFGPDRYDRHFLIDLGLEEPVVTIEKSDDGWSCEYGVSLKTIEALYGNADFKDGDIMKGNFYKCGDETAIPHYASWKPIDMPQPDYHQSAFFGELRITE